MTLKTSDLCDACDAAQACALPFRGFGQRTAFSGAIRTICCFEDICAAALVAATVMSFFTISLLLWVTDSGH